MFPAYGGGRGGGPPPPFYNNNQPWAFPPQSLLGPVPVPNVPPLMGFMLDRGGPPMGMRHPPPHHHHGGGGNRGGGHRSGGRSYQHNNNRGNRQYGEEVVEIGSSDDDNRVEDAVQGSNKRRKRNRSRSPSSSHSSHKRERNDRNRSRSPQGSRHHKKHHRDKKGNDQRQHRHHSHNNRDNERGHHNDNRNQQHQRGQGGYQNDHSQRYRNQEPSYSGGQRNFNEPPPPGTNNPWAIDSNPFDRFEGQGRFGGGRDRHERDFVSREPGPPGAEQDYYNSGPRSFQQQGYGQRQNSFDMQEQRRLQVSQSYPKKVFLEEVELDSEFAFRLDTSSNPTQVNYRSVAMNQKSTYEGGVSKGILGASEEEISKVYSKFHTFRCKLPDSIKDLDDSQNSEDEEDSSKPKKDSHSVGAPIAQNFISLDKDKSNKRRERSQYDINQGLESYSFEHKEGEMSIKEKIEYYNKEVRNQPRNIDLWKEFVQFQDKVFEESSQLFEQEGEGRRGKKKKNRKALLEKKIAILEKAIESNPKCLTLHQMRLEFLLELEKPRNVLTEWKKLVAQHQQIAPFWMEYLLFSSCQYLVFSNSNMINVFETCFQKFQLMLNPQYPDFQRPKKFSLFISDVMLSLSLLLKNAGFVERAVALHQAQLEFDFYCPKNLFKDNTMLGWKDDVKVFETFWDAGTPHFGEITGKGWVHLVENPTEERASFIVPDSKISDFEDETFDSLNEGMKAYHEKQEEVDDDIQELASLSTLKTQQKPNIWVNFESSRSKLYWLPWRKEVSDVDDCEDAQRVVNASDIVNFISPIPSGVSYITDFSRQATHFRHIINFLLTLREDFMLHTQAVDMITSPFRSTTLTESSSLFSEIYYWRNLSDLYVGKKTDSKTYNVFAPEGFKVTDMTSTTVTMASGLKPNLYNLDFKWQGEDEASFGEVIAKKFALLKDNEEKHMDLVQRVIESGVELLEPEFACLLFQIFLRFQQKLTCIKDSDVKQRIKYAKGLMKHEKIRNSIGGYRELAMMEYFGSGNTEKAIGLLLKSINVTTKSLNLNDWDELNWEKDWKSFVDLLSLYRQLVELFLNEQSAESDSKAYYTLVQLGNGFQTLEPDSLEMDENKQWKPKTNALVKAIRSFEKIMLMLIPNFPLKKDTEGNEDKDEVSSSSNDFCSKWDGNLGIEFLLQKKNFIVEWTCCYALFQFFRQDFDAACQVYENTMSMISNKQVQKGEMYDPGMISTHIREHLYINWCSLAARCLVKDPLMNAKFRNVLAQALEEFPSSPPLLILFTDVENQTSIAGKLWRLMMANMKQDSDKVINQWAPLIIGIGLARKIEELEHDEEIGLPTFGLGGPAVPQDTIFYKLDSMISVAEQHPGARHCPLLWRVHLKLLALRAREGKDVKRARATFYDAIRHCPSSKALYLDGVNYFPDLLQEINDLLAEKQLLIRLPLEELDVLLEMDEDMDLDQGNGNGKGCSNKVIEVNDENDDDDDDNDDEDIVEVDLKGKPRKVQRSKESRSDGEIGDSD